MSEIGRDARPADCLAGGGAMGALMRAADWSATPLGAVEVWPQSLRTAISIMLESKFAMVVAWGPDYRFFYNDRYQPILGSKHPAALGMPGAKIFPEVWDVVGPEFDRAWRGEPFAVDDWLLPLERRGYLESCWFTLSYSPIRDESGGVGGVLAVVVETTGRVEGERRLATLRDLARRATDAKAADEACRTTAAVFAQNPVDVPFALLYLVDADGRGIRRVADVGLPPQHPAAIDSLDCDRPDDTGWPLASVLASGQMRVVDDLATRFGVLPGGAWPEPAEAAVVYPLARPGIERPYGVLVAGVSPRRRLDDAYRGFFDLAAEHITTAISNACAFEGERRRAEALAEIDRAKTAFFSNVSHEFRTPLTLMLGPLEDALHGAERSISGETLHLVHRNALRLLKLVNALLDFSRLEAGRVEAVYEPVDLGALTGDLASGFRSAIERAGLTLTLDLQPLSEPVYVDRPMWEKVVLNLLSNAFKFTFEGGIALTLRETPERVIFEVRDSGTGIAAAELPRIFERFRRVEGARSRTEEGSGIGLALVQELVRQHGGTIDVESRVGEGTAFRVSLPRGSAHLPPQRIGAQRALSSTATGAAPYVEEAQRWLGDDLQPSAGAPSAEHILVADDNADIREYLRRILGRRWQVRVVADGAAALEAARAQPPDLVLTDVMMPVLDGFALLRELREDERTRHVPVVMLSARAGEEARVEGLGAGADEYLVKPFGARELVARVASQLALAKERAAAAAHRAEADLQKRNFASLLLQAPTPVCVLRGPQLVIELANAPC
ncbi:MAG TPA: ATP-binding protein, partial [Thermoanaerobaculia bacterium]|nr:ATP-binding protein [Thermoanaerobaculia bacterium]